jgi:DNA polymerase III delta prime subunit
MPAAIDEHIRRKVIQQWFNGLPRDKIAEENNLGARTVSSIVANYKVSLEEQDFDSIRQLAIEARQHGLNLSELASNFRIHNFIKTSGLAEEDIESFITNIISGDVCPENIVLYVNQLFAVSSEQSIPLDQVPNYIKEKLEEKKKIDDQIKEADVILQSKNVSIEAINEHIALTLYRHYALVFDIKFHVIPLPAVYHCF